MADVQLRNHGIGKLEVGDILNGIILHWSIRHERTV